VKSRVEKSVRLNEANDGRVVSRVFAISKQPAAESINTELTGQHQATTESQTRRLGDGRRLCWRPGLSHQRDTTNPLD